MRGLVAATLFGVCLAGAPARAADQVEKLPAPVLAFAQQFERECRDNGLGHLMVNENYADDGRSEVDINADGQKDYLVYKCMFGCSRDTFAFIGKASPCPWGSLMLSNPSGYDQVFLPGRVTRLRIGVPVKVSIRRPRSLGNFCKDQSANYDPEYVYQLKDGRFQLQGVCLPNSSTDCLSSSGS